MKIHTLSFPTFGLTYSFQDFVDPRNCMGPPDRVVSYLLTFFLRSSRRNVGRDFLTVTHCNSNASVYPINPFRCMVTVGPKARVFV
jgi:hypothetical protein